MRLETKPLLWWVSPSDYLILQSWAHDGEVLTGILHSTSPQMEAIHQQNGKPKPKPKKPCQHCSLKLNVHLLKMFHHSEPMHTLTPPTPHLKSLWLWPIPSMVLTTLLPCPHNQPSAEQVAFALGPVLQILRNTLPTPIALAIRNPTRVVLGNLPMSALHSTYALLDITTQDLICNGPNIHCALVIVGGQLSPETVTLLTMPKNRQSMQSSAPKLP